MAFADIWRRKYDTPFLAQWKTDVLFSVLGLALRMMIVWTIANLGGFQQMMEEALQTGTLTLTRDYVLSAALFDVTVAIAAFLVIPRRFTKRYAGKNHIVSLMNTLIGGLVFGCWWNYRLTKKNPGVSHLVFFVFLATNGFSSLTMLMLT